MTGVHIPHIPEGLAMTAKGKTLPDERAGPDAAPLSATTYQYLGQSYWDGHPPYHMVHGQPTGVFGEEVLLDQALVSSPGQLP